MSASWAPGRTGAWNEGGDPSQGEVSQQRGVSRAGVLDTPPWEEVGNPQRGRRRQGCGVSCPNCAEITVHVLSSAGQLSVLCPTSALRPPPRAHSAASSHPIIYQGVALCLSNASFSSPLGITLPSPLLRMSPCGWVHPIRPCPQGT